MGRFKIAIIGPESTGKSTLTKQLAEKYQTQFVSEYARTFIEQLERKYVYEDLITIAKIQKQQTDNLFYIQKKSLFTDTSLLTIEIWSRDKFNKCNPWIINEIQNERFDLYLLCDIDFPWIYDKQREDSHRRKEIFDLYKQYLNKYSFKYESISGIGKERINNAVKSINKHLKIEN